VLATKFTNNASPKAGILVTGNSRKSMVAAAEASPKRLRTDRIDLYWAHMPDDVTPSEEIVRGFDDFSPIRQGALCGAVGLPRLAGCPRGDHRRAARAGADRRSPVRIQPDRAHDRARPVADGAGAWLGRRHLVAARRRAADRKVPARRDRAGRSLGGRVFQPEDSAQRTAVLDELLALAKDIGATASQVAIAWVAAKVPFTIIGPRTVEQLADNLGALKVALTSEQLARLDEVSAIPKTFPHSLMSQREIRQRIAGGKLDQLDLPMVPVA
jgi:aryl-alcohol dehydrogenase-like predicted oxidoreductase